MTYGIPVDNDSSKVHHKGLNALANANESHEYILKICELPFHEFMHLKDACAHHVASGSGISPYDTAYAKRVSHSNYGQHHLLLDSLHSVSNVHGGSFKSFIRGISHVASKVGSFVKKGARVLQPVTHAISGILDKLPIDDPRFKAIQSAMHGADQIQSAIAK